jgi:hypothetical protein
MTNIVSLSRYRKATETQADSSPIDDNATIDIDHVPFTTSEVWTWASSMLEEADWLSPKARNFLGHLMMRSNMCKRKFLPMSDKQSDWFAALIDRHLSQTVSQLKEG